MEKKSLEDKAQKLAWEVTKRPWLYMKLVRAINKGALAVGWVLSLFRR
jgi:hypothetical protein